MWKHGPRDDAWNELHSAIQQFSLGEIDICVSSKSSERNIASVLTIFAYPVLIYLSAPSAVNRAIRSWPKTNYNTAIDVMVADGRAPKHFTVCATRYKLGYVALNDDDTDKAM